VFEGAAVFVEDGTTGTVAVDVSEAVGCSTVGEGLHPDSKKKIGKIKIRKRHALCLAMILTWQ
jgi:hypothetical protein